MHWRLTVLQSAILLMIATAYREVAVRKNRPGLFDLIIFFIFPPQIKGVLIDLKISNHI